MNERPDNDNPADPSTEVIIATPLFYRRTGISGVTSGDSNMASSSVDQARVVAGMCEKGMWREVQAFAQQWRDANPTDPRAYYYLGAGLSGLRRFSQAEAAYRQALRLDPTDFEVWTSLAELLFKKMRLPEEGLHCLEQALQANPRHTLGWLSLARLAGRMGCHDKALACANQAIALDPQLVEAYLSKAAAARALGKHEVVKEVCHGLAALKPENFRRAS
ncbi:MAG: tetratricopeptide repeat protein [Verrucomicrobiota bacterium]